MFPNIQKALLDLVLDQNKLFFQYPDSRFFVVCQIDLSVFVAVVAYSLNVRSRLPHIQDRQQFVRHGPGDLQHAFRL